MFKLFVVAVFLFSFASLVANATEFERKGIAQEPMQIEPMIEPRPEIDPSPIFNTPSDSVDGKKGDRPIPEGHPDPWVNTPEGEEGCLPVPIPRPVDEHGIEADPDPIYDTPEPTGEGYDRELDFDPMFDTPEPAGERHDRELDPTPMF